ncbi:hypothetical protein THERMOS_1398 [Bathymodiolus thermophilus thioautotrophic gill symbiont]|uniref:Uncharacterized protein n=1 Tax=Bathymodiolus thermophilus thioautotrophic gill symbiont TaxID=2360 RepID=A0A8H8XEL0_9GAMM|nr:hypothetical protein THERMOS_1398 [Bathymodiolus thermophilus thioautotrophic gill symbiont]
MIPVGNKKYNNFSNELEIVNQYLATKFIRHYLKNNTEK